jgi:hypothetical protein
MFMTYFKQTCDKPYDRHKYKLVFKNKKAVVFDDWDLARAAWFEWCQTGNCVSIQVIDHKGGFK